MSAPSAFKKYNQVQKALSAHAKESGYTFKGTGRNFSQLAAQVFHDKSGRDIDTILEDIYRGNEPIFPSSLLECFKFYDFDGEGRETLGRYNREVMQGNLIVASPQILGYEVPASKLDYSHIQDFTLFCNTNFNVWWVSSDDAPEIRFTEPEWDEKGKRWVTQLVPCVPDAYGYTPGLGAEQVDWEPELELEPPAPPPVTEDIIEQKKEAAALRTEKIKTLELKIKKQEAKIEKQKAKKKTGALKLLKRYEKYYKQGILTKAEFKKKILELEL